MSAVELFLQDGRLAGIWYCSECHIVFEKESDALACHTPQMCACGQPVRARFYDDCNECNSKAWAAKCEAEELERFEKSTKIEAKDFHGDQVFINDQYYDTVHDAIDSFVLAPPKYIWAAKDEGIPLADIDDILERMLDGMWEGASVDDLLGTEQLQKAINAFNKKNRAVVMYVPDYSTAILITK